ncbi:unnamed protein product [Closterium sp. NIES-53]
MLPYLFPDLAAFDTVADLITHLRTSDAHYRAALPTEFCAKNPSPPKYITLYYLVTRLPDSLASVKDHFLSLCPTELIVDLLEERLAAAEKSIFAVGASHGDRRTPFFEGCSPVPLLPSVTSAAAVDLVGTEEVGAASAPSGRRRNSKGKGNKGVGGDDGGGGGDGGGGEGGGGGGAGGAGSGGFSGGGGGGGGSGGGGGGSGSGGGGSGGGGGGGGGGGAGRGAAAQRGGIGGLGVLVPALTQNVAIFDLDFDAILAAMYALTDSAKVDCYLSVPPNPSIEAAALGASASAAPGAGESALSGTAPTEALHIFTLDSGASRSFLRDSTTLTLLSRLSQSPWLTPLGAQSLRTLPRGADLQDTWVDQFAPGGQRVTHCTCSRTGRHLATFTRRPGLSLYTLTTASPPVSASRQVAASSQVFAAASRSSPALPPCSCRPLSHETLFWHHRLGHPSLPRLRGMASRTLVSGLPRSLPPLPLGPAPTCVPCVEGRQHAAPHSSTFPPTEAPMQTLHMDVWGPARVRGQGHERYFLLVVDDYSCYTTVFPLRSKGELSSRAFPCVFLGFPPDAPRWQFYHPTSRRVLSSQDVTFDESVSYYRPGTPPVDPLPPQGPAPSGVSQVDSAEPVEVAVDSGAARGAEPAGAGPGGAETGGAEPERVESGGAEPERMEPGGVESGGVESGGAEPARAESGGSPGVQLRRESLSPQRLREWYARRCCRATGAAGARAAGGAASAGAAGGAAGAGAAGGAAGAGAGGGAAAAGTAGGAAGTGAVGGAAGAGATGGAAGAGAAGGAAGAGAAGFADPGGARTGGTGAAGDGVTVGVGAAVNAAGGAAGVATGDPRAEGTGAVSVVSARPRPYYVPLLGFRVHSLAGKDLSYSTVFLNKPVYRVVLVTSVEIQISFY